MNSITISNLKITNFNDIIKIADSQFGKGYLSVNELNSYLLTSLKFGICAKLNKKLIGFALIQIDNKNHILNLILKEKKTINEYLVTSNAVGLIKLVAVEEKYKKQGVGKTLVEKSISSISNLVDCLLSVCWINKSGSELAPILEKFGMLPIITIPNYWKYDSIKLKYTCSICGCPPCSCNAVVYGKKLSIFL